MNLTGTSGSKSIKHRNFPLANENPSLTEKPLPLFSALKTTLKDLFFNSSNFLGLF